MTSESIVPEIQLSDTQMTEAEVSLRLATYILQLPGASNSVDVALDDQHRISAGKIIFPIAEFLIAEGWTLTKPQGKQPWQGVYERGDHSILLTPESRGGDVVATIGGRRLRAECKKGPLVKTKGNPQNKLIHEAIGQLMTVETVDATDVLVVAIPQSAPCRAKVVWEQRPLMRRIGILLALVGRDGTVEGLPDFSA